MNFVVLSLGCVVAASAMHANAQVFNLRNSAVPEISIQIGGGGGNVSTVTFDIPATNVADGTPVPGSKKVRINLRARATPSNSRLVSLQLDSSIPMVNGDVSLPFTQISWTAKDGDIPAGTYAGISGQVLVEFLNSRRLQDFHTFTYANTLPVAEGTYTGQVVYTLVMP